MRRTARRLIAALISTLALTLLVSPGIALAGDADTILATEVGDEAPGPEPAGRHDEGNLGAPTEHAGPPFARFVAAVLTIAAVGGLLTVGYLYFLFVKRPQSRQSTGA